MNKYRWVFFPFMICAIVSIGLYVLLEVRDDFSTNNIEYESPELEAWSTTNPSIEETAKLGLIFEQKFSYLGKGHQIYAFSSEDGKYVLKFIKFTYLKPFPVLQKFSFFPFLSQYHEKRERRRLKRLARVLNGYKIGFEKDRENTALLFVHFSKTPLHLQKVLLVDRYGFHHHLQLDSHFFILQKKGHTTRQILHQLLKQHRLDEAKQSIRQILDLYVTEYKNGLYDDDHNVLDNTGFVEGKAVRLDVGRLLMEDVMADPSKYQEDLNKISFKRLKKWLHKNYPFYANDILEDMQIKLEEIFL